MKHYTLFTLLFCIFIGLLGIGIMIPVLPVFMTELGAGGFDMGLIMAAFSVSRALLQPFIGGWSDHIGRKYFLVAGLCVYGVVGLLIPTSTSVAMLIVVRLLQGVGSAMMQPVAMAYMSALSPTGKEGQYQSYLNVAVFLGIGCGPLLGGLISDHCGMPAVFHSMAIVSFFAMILTIVSIPNQEGDGKQDTPRFFDTMATMWNNRRTRGILLTRYATMLIPVPTMAFLPLLLTSWNDVPFSGFSVGMVIACKTLINAVMQFPFGAMADKFDKCVQLIWGCTLLAIVLFIIPFCRQFTGIMLLYALLGTIEALLWAVLGAYASIEGKTYYGHGTMMGMYGLSMSCGVFTGAVLSGISMDWLGIGEAYQIIAAGVFVLSYVGIRCIYIENRKEKQVEK